MDVKRGYFVDGCAIWGRIAGRKAFTSQWDGSVHACLLDLVQEKAPRSLDSLLFWMCLESNWEGDLSLWKIEFSLKKWVGFKNEGWKLRVYFSLRLKWIMLGVAFTSVGPCSRLQSAGLFSTSIKPILNKHNILQELSKSRLPLSHTGNSPLLSEHQANPHSLPHDSN